MGSSSPESSLALRKEAKQVALRGRGRKRGRACAFAEREGKETREIRMSGLFRKEPLGRRAAQPLG